eukprot:TRINITY_DN10254_c0_g1_i2.p1 TRINITY_DN10254_c0_g1~~TRINITY_DN10254_c0_g1_i2.p1  ORF type:complete len:540 (-),score=62.92 TRINITY_DN10254_c0_g1_i2:125-1744(-)
MIKIFVYCLLLLICGHYVASQATFSYASVLFDETTKQFNIKSGIDKSGVAYGAYQNGVETQGWDQLWITATTNYADEIRAFGIGFLEGYLSRDAISNYWQTLTKLADTQVFPNQSVREKVLLWLRLQNAWTISQIRTNANDSYWQQVSFIQTQLNGIYSGYNLDHPSTPISYEDFLMLNSFPDILDIVNFVSVEDRIDWYNIDSKQAERLFTERTHCSSLTKLLPGNKDIFSGHTTWIFFSMLNRIFKHIVFPQTENPNVTPGYSFSSYPGQLQSADDFYVLSNKLAVIETSISVFNTKLYNLCTPQSLLSWQRTLLANRLAQSGSQWSSIFSKFNSGTYNNEWLILDFNKFSPGSLPESGFLHIVDQAPGQVFSQDVTPIFNNKGYWPSYNIPFISAAYDLLGYPEMVKAHGDFYSYDNTVRANIFRRNHTMVSDLQTMKSMMQYNNFQSDPLAEGQPTGAIASRFDLAPTSPMPFGGTDSKIVSSESILDRVVFGICGPTHDQQTPFDWSKFPDWPHYGQPTVWNFNWIVLNSTLVL